MPDLYHTFLKYDLGHLRIVAGLWGLELESNEADPAAEELAAAILDPEPVHETMRFSHPMPRPRSKCLPHPTAKWSGAPSPAGSVKSARWDAGKRDRERPHLKPISAAETLFYYGFLAKAFFDADKGAQEFAYIPEDLLELLKIEGFEEKKGEPLGTSRHSRLKRLLRFPPPITSSTMLLPCLPPCVWAGRIFNLTYN